MSKSFCAQEIVKEFTVGASTKQYPNGPVLASADEARFISKMVISEILELLLTIYPTIEEVKSVLHETVDDLDLPTSNIPCSTKVGDVSPPLPLVIEAQMDAVADILYYLYDFSTKKGYNIDRIMDLVHGANMAKRHSDGLFHKRSDGKVIKPEGWKEADLLTEVLAQIKSGSDLVLTSSDKSPRGKEPF